MMFEPGQLLRVRYPAHEARVFAWDADGGIMGWTLGHGDVVIYLDGCDVAGWETLAMTALSRYGAGLVYFKSIQAVS